MRWIKDHALACWLVALVILCVVLWKWPQRYPNPDILLGSDVIAMAVLGGIVAVFVPQTQLGKLLYPSVFILLGVIGWRLTIQQADDTKQAEHRLNSTLTGIAEEVTGGDSFCYVDIRQWGGMKDSVRASLLQKGRYPLTNVDIRIVQIDDLLAHLQTPETLSEIERNFSLPFVRRGSFIKPLSDYAVAPSEDSRAFNVFIVARNGRFTESVRLRRVNGAWNTAKIVDVSYYSGLQGVALEEADKDFPIETLTSDKDWIARKDLKRLTIKETDQ